MFLKCSIQLWVFGSWKKKKKTLGIWFDEKTEKSWYLAFKIGWISLRLWVDLI